MGGSVDGVDGLGHLGLGVEQGAQLVHRGLALLVGVVLLDQELDGLEEPVQVQEEGDQGTEGEVVVGHHGAADGQHDGLAEDAQHLGARSVDGVDVGRVVVGVPVVADHVAVVDHVVALAVVGGHDADAVEALGQVGQHVGDPVADPVVAALGGPLEPDRGADQRRDDQHHGDEGQQHVGGEQDDGDDHHGQRLDGQLGEAVLQELLEVLDVAGHAAHDHAGLLLGEEAEREALEVGEDLDPEVVHDPGGQPAGHLHLEPLGQRGDDDEHQVGDGHGHDDAEVEVARGPPMPLLMAYSVSFGPTWAATEMTTTRSPARTSMPGYLVRRLHRVRRLSSAS